MTTIVHGKGVGPWHVMPQGFGRGWKSAAPCGAKPSQTIGWAYESEVASPRDITCGRCRDKYEAWIKGAKA